MIFTASYFKPEHHHGRLISISRSMPDALPFVVERSHLTELLAPPQGTHDYWERIKKQAQAEKRQPTEQEWELFKTGYRLHIKKNAVEIKECLDFRNPHEHETWLCWEHPGSLCHRNLAFELVSAWYPCLAGGQDTTEAPALDYIGVGASVRHTNPECIYGKAKGKVVLMHGVSEVSVLFEMPEVETVSQHGRTYNRFNRPVRLPISLLEVAS